MSREQHEAEGYAARVHDEPLRLSRCLHHANFLEGRACSAPSSQPPPPHFASPPLPPLPRHNPSPPSCRRPTFSCEFSNFFLFFLSAAVMHSLEEKVGSTKGRFGRREKLHQGRKAKSLTAIFFSFFKLNDAKLQ